MKRNKIKYDRWLRTLALSFALLMAGGMTAWGQQRPEISLVPSENHDNVHYEVKTIYVDPLKPRKLSLPELNINTRSGSDVSYNWFVHWYVKGEGTIRHEVITVTNDQAQARGGFLGVKTDNTYVTKDYFAKVKETEGLIWSNRLKEDNVVTGGLGIDASTITYELPNGYTGNDIVYCDVSIYKDGKKISNNNYQEPTLLKRYIYEIKTAEECISQINGNPDPDSIYFPKGSEFINFSMPYAPDNYFWKEGDLTHQGAKFQYRIVGESSTFEDFKLITKTASLTLQQNQKLDVKNVTEDFTVEVRAVCETQGHTGESPIINRFTFRPIENANFLLEKDIDKTEQSVRWPRGNTKKYELIGLVDFDQDRATKEIGVGDNMSDEPLGSFNDSYTTYGFLAKNGKSLLDKDGKCFTSAPGIYGLFRSANALGHSRNDNECSTEAGVNRVYKWITPYIEKAHNHTVQMYQEKPLYDRTYEITKGTNDEKYGFFYYIDATDEP